MHIPDGYLSPSTCAALYLTAAPFWYTAMRKVKSALTTRLVPMLSLMAAFSFVVMMFNLPLPGGTTGHATGIGIATIVLGPWAAMLAMSVALLIQAIFFGDGGVTALGANCFNMAIVGSLVTYGVYRLISGGAALDSRRRVVAAAIAGYASINVSALLAAIEFGIQPVLFKNGDGTPIYAPYPLSIALPAMMIGHLTIAGLAELFVSGGVVAYLQRADPSLLRATAPLSIVVGTGQNVTRAPEQPITRKLWLALAILLLLTPLGLLAAGSAWGEWNPGDFSDSAGRSQIAAASAGVEPPSSPPRGLARLSGIWTAPISRYAPPFMKSAAFGYLMSAMAGTGLILILMLGLRRLILRRDPSHEIDPAQSEHNG